MVFLPPILQSYAGTPCSIFLDQACVCIIFSYTWTINIVFIYDIPIIFILQVEVKPYVLDDQLCDECQGARCGGKFAPFFCANVTCLQVCSIHTVRLSKIEYIEYKLSFHVQKDGGVFWKFWNEIRISGLESVQNFENLWLSKLLLVRKIGIFTYLGFGVTMMRGILYQSCTLCRLMFQSQPNGLLRLRFLITKPGTSKNV